MNIIKAIKGCFRTPVVETGDAKIFYWRGSKGWYWHLIAANGEVIAQGEGYTTKAGVLKGIGNVRALMAVAVVAEK